MSLDGIRLKVQLSKEIERLTNLNDRKFMYYLDKNRLERIEQLKFDLFRRIFNLNEILNNHLNLHFSIDNFEILDFESTNVFRDLDILNICLNQPIKKRKLDQESELKQIKNVKKQNKQETTSLNENFELKKPSQNLIIKPFEACLIGTSMVKHIDTNKLFDDKKCFFKSISGGLINDIFEFVKKRDGFFKNCKFIVITCGSNDCDSLNNINKIIDDYIELSQYLHKTYPNSNLIFNELIPRLKTKYVDLSVYDEKRICFNNFLNSTLSHLITCKIVPHPMFEIKSELDRLLTDGVHMSPLKGVPIYIEDIKNCLNNL